MYGDSLAVGVFVCKHMFCFLHSAQLLGMQCGLFLSSIGSLGPLVSVSFFFPILLSCLLKE